MATTVLKTGKITNVTTLDDADDFDMGASFPNEDTHGNGEFRIRRISYVGNANDRLLVRNVGVGAAVICDLLV